MDPFLVLFYCRFIQSLYTIAGLPDVVNGFGFMIVLFFYVCLFIHSMFMEPSFLFYFGLPFLTSKGW